MLLARDPRSPARASCMAYVSCMYVCCIYVRLSLHACHTYSVHLLIFGNHAQAFPRQMQLDHMVCVMHAFCRVCVPRLGYVL